MGDRSGMGWSGGWLGQGMLSLFCAHPSTGPLLFFCRGGLRVGLLAEGTFLMSHHVSGVVSLCLAWEQRSGMKIEFKIRWRDVRR